MSAATSSTTGRKEISLFLFIIFAYISTYSILLMIASFYPIEARARGLDGKSTSFVFSMNSIVQLVVTPFVGKMTYLIGERKSVVIGFLILGLSQIAFGFVGSFKDKTTFLALSMLFRGLSGAASVVIDITILSIVYTAFPNSMATAMTVVEFGVSIGVALGPFIGGILYQFGDFKLPFMVMGGNALIFVLISLFVLPKDLEKSLTHEEEENTKNKKKEKSLLSVFLIPGIIVNIYTLFVSSASMSIIQSNMSDHLKDITNNHIKTGLIGAIIFCFGIGYGFGGLIISQLTDRKIIGRRGMVLVWSIVLAALFFVIDHSSLFNTATPTPLYTAFILFITGVGSAAEMVIPTVLIRDYIVESGLPEDKRTSTLVASIFTGTISIGVIFGFQVNGFLKEKLPFGLICSVYGLMFCTVTISLSVLAFWEDIRHHKKRKTED